MGRDDVQHPLLNPPLAGRFVAHGIASIFISPNWRGGFFPGFQGKNALFQQSHGQILRIRFRHAAQPVGSQLHGLAPEDGAVALGHLVLAGNLAAKFHTLLITRLWVQPPVEHNGKLGEGNRLAGTVFGFGNSLGQAVSIKPAHIGDGPTGRVVKGRRLVLFQRLLFASEKTRYHHSRLPAGHGPFQLKALVRAPKQPQLKKHLGQLLLGWRRRRLFRRPGAADQQQGRQRGGA